MRKKTTRPQPKDPKVPYIYLGFLGVFGAHSIWKFFTQGHNWFDLGFGLFFFALIALNVWLYFKQRAQAKEQKVAALNLALAVQTMMDRSALVQQREMDKGLTLQVLDKLVSDRRYAEMTEFSDAAATTHTTKELHLLVYEYAPELLRDTNANYYPPDSV